MDNLLEQISEAKKKFLNSDPVDKQVIEGWEAEAKRHLMTQSLRGNKGVEMILENYQKDIASMNDILLNDRTLTDLQRISLLDRREMYEKFIRIFNDAEAGIKKLEKEVNDNL